MVKRIIFDLDNTLIPWDNNWYKEIPKLFEYYNISFKDDYYGLFDKAISDYEDITLRYNYLDLTKYLSKYMNVDLPDEFMEKITERFSTLVPPIDNNLIDLLKYLSSKYSLVVATNWFKYQQVEKLKNYKIFEYIDEVITGEDFDIKPNTAMFDYLKEGYLDDEVVMVGDSYKTDIKGAINSKIHAYFITKDDNYHSNRNYTVIKDILELRNYL